MIMDCVNTDLTLASVVRRISIEAVGNAGESAVSAGSSALALIKCISRTRQKTRKAIIVEHEEPENLSEFKFDQIPMYSAK